MPSSWEREVKAARTALDQANQQAAHARSRLHATANAAYRDGARPTDIAAWAQVTTQALHLWRKEPPCRESQ